MRERSQPRLILKATSLELVTTTGVHWDVQHCKRVGGKLVPVGRGSAAAEAVVFTARDGERRIYTLRPNEAGELNPVLFAEHLAQAVPSDEHVMGGDSAPSAGDTPHQDGDLDSAPKA